MDAGDRFTAETFVRPFTRQFVSSRVCKNYYLLLTVDEFIRWYWLFYTLFTQFFTIKLSPTVKRISDNKKLIGLGPFLKHFLKLLSRRL